MSRRTKAESRAKLVAEPLSCNRDTGSSRKLLVTIICGWFQREQNRISKEEVSGVASQSSGMRSSGLD